MPETSLKQLIDMNLYFCGKKVSDYVWNHFLIQFIIYKDLWLFNGFQNFIFFQFAFIQIAKKNLTRGHTSPEAILTSWEKDMNEGVNTLQRLKETKS